MNISEDAQEMLEKLWIKTVEQEQEFVELNMEEKNRCIVKQLVDSGYIKPQNNKLRLTSEGVCEAERIVRRHRLAERLLQDVLEVEEEEMNSSACKFEHIISEGVEESICTLLGHPRFCPHGRFIPPSKCCKEGKDVAEKIVSPLSKLKKGHQGKICYIQTKNHKKLQKLLAIGVLPGIPVKVIQTYPSYVFQIENSQIAVDEEIADDIFVRLEEKVKQS